MCGNGTVSGTLITGLKAMGDDGAWWMGWSQDSHVVLVLGGTCDGLVCGSIGGGDVPTSTGGTGHGEWMVRNVVCSQCPVVLATAGTSGLPQAVARHDHPAAAVKRLFGCSTTSLVESVCLSCGRRYCCLRASDRVETTSGVGGNYENQGETLDSDLYYGFLESTFVDCKQHVVARSSAQADIELNPGPGTKGGSSRDSFDQRGLLFTPSAVFNTPLHENTLRALRALEETQQFLDSRIEEVDDNDGEGGGDSDSVSSVGSLVGALELYDMPRLVAAPEPWTSDATSHRVMAWICGAQHQTDVQRAIVLAGIPMEEATIKMQSYVSNAARRAYYVSARNPTVLTAGESDTAYGNAFKASYTGVFRSNYLRWLEGHFPVARHSGMGLQSLLDDVERDMSAYDKEYCTKCECYVRSDGHDGRCRPVDSASSRERELAWTGDALHTLDVRRMLLRCKLPAAKLQVVAQTLLSATAQRSYLRRVGDDDMTQSERAASTVFEAHYSMLYREGYLHYLRDKLNSTFGAGINENVVSLMLDETLFDA